VQSYAGVVVSNTGIDYHVKMAQGIGRQLVEDPELHTEALCQLVKLTSGHP